MNAALATRLAGEAGVSTFDIFGLGSAFFLNPAAFGLTNATDACGAKSNVNCDQYVYWDGIHPMAAGHEVIAEAMLAIAAPVPEPETWALVVAGLAAIGWATRHRPKALHRA